MKKEQLEKMSDDELKTKYKSATSVLQVAMILLFIYVVYLVYSIAASEWKPNFSAGVVILLFLAIILPNYTLRKQMKAEMQKRKSA